MRGSQTRAHGDRRRLLTYICPICTARRQPGPRLFELRAAIVARRCAEKKRTPPPMPSSDKLPRHPEVKDNNDLHDRGRGTAERRARLANQAPLLCLRPRWMKKQRQPRRREGERERERGEKKREPDFGMKRLKQKLPRSAACGSGGAPATYYELNKCNYISELARERRRGRTRPGRDD